MSAAAAFALLFHPLSADLLFSLFLSVLLAADINCVIIIKRHKYTHTSRSVMFTVSAAAAAGDLR